MVLAVEPFAAVCAARAPMHLETKFLRYRNDPRRLRLAVQILLMSLLLTLLVRVAFPFHEGLVDQVLPFEIAP